MEFLLLALGGGALALSRSKSLKQVDQMVSQASKAAGGKSVYQIMNESLTKRGNFILRFFGCLKVSYRIGGRLQGQDGQGRSFEDTWRRPGRRRQVNLPGASLTNDCQSSRQGRLAIHCREGERGERVDDGKGQVEHVRQIILFNLFIH